MNPGGLDEIEDLFAAALKLSPDQRREYLKVACRGDQALFDEVDSLLREHEEGEDFLASPVAVEALKLFEASEPDAKTESGPDPITQSQFGEYRILAKLGEGGMGVVYLATRRDSQVKIALKLISELQLSDRMVRKRFLREARAASDLVHPGICAIREYGSVQDRDFIAMEYVEGPTLEAEMRAERLSVSRVLQISLEIAQALEQAHLHGVVHRDLKPSNIMFTAQGRVKVLDFGLAKLVPDAEGVAPETMTQLTMEGAAIGTLAYMSPEQLRGLGVDLRSDIFSLGVLIYEMLTGSHPFRRRTHLETASAVIGEREAPMRRLRDRIPDRVPDTVSAMMEKEATRRLASMSEVVSALELLKSASASPGRSGLSRAVRSFFGRKTDLD